MPPPPAPRRPYPSHRVMSAARQFGDVSACQSTSGRSFYGRSVWPTPPCSSSSSSATLCSSTTLPGRPVLPWLRRPHRRRRPHRSTAGCREARHADGWCARMAHANTPPRALLPRAPQTGRPAKKEHIPPRNNGPTNIYAMRGAVRGNGLFRCKHEAPAVRPREVIAARLPG